MHATRSRSDRCPGVTRPWEAADGMLVRLRLVGGRVRITALRALLDVAEEFGDGRIYLTSRANLQVRGLPGEAGQLTASAMTALSQTGLLPSPSHELVRNIMVSPLTGLSGGRADLRALAAELDSGLCGSASLSALGGRFLFVLDDGRGDLLVRSCDLGLVALDDSHAQLRIGNAWGPVVTLAESPQRLVWLAEQFVLNRGDGVNAAWHVPELREPLTPAEPPDPRLPSPSGALAFGVVPVGLHQAVPETGLGRLEVDALTNCEEIVVTPWRGILIAQAR